MEDPFGFSCPVVCVGLPLTSVLFSLWQLNTFQAVIAYNDEDTYTIFLYPNGGLQFLGTRPKESYNVQLELPARVGFSWGDSDDPKRDGLFFHSLASSEQALRNLER